MRIITVLNLNKGNRTMRISEGIETTRDKVSSLLCQYEQLRDDDQLLYLAFLNKYLKLRENIGIDAYNKLKEILTSTDTPKFESVTRARRLIQEQGLYQGTKRDLRIDEQQDVINAVRK